jgi:hypothetical protein
MNLKNKENIEEKNEMNSNVKYNLNINFKNRNNLIQVDFNTTISELKQIIFTYFKLDFFDYDLYYKNTKISFNDNRPIALLFQYDFQTNPILFIVEKNKNINILSKRAIYSVEIRTKYSLDKLKIILNKFFEYKNCPNDAVIKSNLKDIYYIKFRRALMAKEFKQFFDVNYNNKLKFSSNSVILPKINKSIEISNSNDNIKNNKSYSNKKMNSIVYKKEEDNFEKAEFPIKYINSEEKYYRGKIIDSRNWLYGKGFINNTNKYNINHNYHFIKNYVGATPNIPPILHKFRDVSKNLWIDKRGFFP